MQAETLNCPMCGAPAASDATSCEHCGARLATVACPSCFGMIFEGAKFCSHCGAKVDRTEGAEAVARACPHGHGNMESVTVGNTKILECAKCEGIWVDNDTFQQICADREKQSAVLGIPTHLPPADPASFEPVHYFKCPVCNELMNRVNFAHCSHVIVNVCGKHGTWFEKDELRKVIEFIRAGGLEKARTDEIAELQHQRSMAQIAPISGGLSGGGALLSPSPRYDGYDIAFGLVGAALKLFLK